MTAEFAKLVVERTKRAVGYDIYRAQLMVRTPVIGDWNVVEDFEVTLKPEHTIDLFIAADVAVDRLTGAGYRKYRSFTSRGSYGSAVMVRDAL